MLYFSTVFLTVIGSRQAINLLELLFILLLFQINKDSIRTREMVLTISPSEGAGFKHDRNP